MSITHAVTTQWEQSNNAISYRTSVVGDSEINISASIADSTTDGQLVCALDISEIKSIIIGSDQDITVETNSGSAADDTFTILANNPLVWNSSSPLDNPFSADITDLYITNASGSAATVEVRALVDATP